MPLTENFDMDRFSATARLNASVQSTGVNTRLDDCESPEAAQTRLAGVLFDASGKRTALNRRLLKLAARITRDAELALDCVNSAYLGTARNWQRVTDVSGYMFRSVRNEALLIKRKHRAEQLTDDVAVLVETESHYEYRPVADGAVRSLAAIAEVANANERKVLALCASETWDGLKQFPTMDAIATEMCVSEATLRNYMKQLGLRAGVWTNDKRWFRVAAGPRRSQHWFNQQRAQHVWSVLAWFATKGDVQC